MVEYGLEMFLSTMGNNPKQKLSAKIQYSKREKWIDVQTSKEWKFA